jgi:flagellar basal-body rod protein FlgB
MPLSIDSYLGSLPQALQLRSRRTELLASNLANVDTPNYKARDIDFRAALSKAHHGQLSLKTTQSGHIQDAATTNMGGVPVQFRVPTQPSLDGNTVVAETEKAQFSENAVNYQATLHFLSGKFRSIKSTLKGE